MAAFARQKANVRHANHRQPVPSLGSHRAAGARSPNRVRRLARTEVASEPPRCNNRASDCAANALIVISKGPQTRPVLLPRISDHVHHLAAIAQIAGASPRSGKDVPGKFASIPSTRSSSIGCPIDSWICSPSCDPSRMMVNSPTGHCSARCNSTASWPTRSAFSTSFNLFDQFVAAILPLPAKRIRIRPLLNFTSGKRVGRISRAGRVFRLMNVGALGRKKP